MAVTSVAALDAGAAMSSMTTHDCKDSVIVQPKTETLLTFSGNEADLLRGITMNHLLTYLIELDGLVDLQTPHPHLSPRCMLNRLTEQGSKFNSFTRC